MISFGGNVSFGNGAGANDVSFSQVETVEEVVRQRDEALAELGQARKKNVDGPPGLDTGLGIAEPAISSSAQAHRTRVVSGKSVKVRVDHACLRIIKKNQHNLVHNN